MVLVYHYHSLLPLISSAEAGRDVSGDNNLHLNLKRSCTRGEEGQVEVEVREMLVQGHVVDVTMVSIILELLHSVHSIPYLFFSIPSDSMLSRL